MPTARIPRGRHANIGVLTGPAQRHGFDVLLAVVLPDRRYRFTAVWLDASDVKRINPS